LRKLGFTLNAHHVALPYSYPFYAYDVPTILRFLVVGPWLLIPLGLVGLAVLLHETRGRLRRPLLIWMSFVPLYAASVALFFVADRYRLPLFVPLCVGSGVALDRLATMVAGREWRALLLPAVATVLVAAASQWNPGLDDGRWMEGIRLTQRFVILKRHEDVDAWVTRLSATSATPGLAHYHAGLQYSAERDWERAVHYLSAAHQLRPVLARDQVPVDSALGQALLGAGRAASTPASGEPFFRRGTELLPDDGDARLQYGLNLLLLKRFEDAEVQLSHAVRLKPRDADAHAHLALAVLSLDRPADAQVHAARALAIQPGHRLAQSVLAAVR
jgi:hypothetical protein